MEHLTLRPDRLDHPTRWQRPQLIFVNSMSDLFHKNVPTDYIRRVFDTMERADWHIYQVLTKRSSLMRRFVQKRVRFRLSGCGPCATSVRPSASPSSSSNGADARQKREGIHWMDKSGRSIRKWRQVRALVGCYKR